MCLLLVLEFVSLGWFWWDFGCCLGFKLGIWLWFSVGGWVSGLVCGLMFDNVGLGGWDSLFGLSVIRLINCCFELI